MFHSKQCGNTALIVYNGRIWSFGYIFIKFSLSLYNYWNSFYETFFLQLWNIDCKKLSEFKGKKSIYTLSTDLGLKLGQLLLSFLSYLHIVFVLYVTFLVRSR